MTENVAIFPSVHTDAWDPDADLCACGDSIAGIDGYCELCRQPWDWRLREERAA